MKIQRNPKLTLYIIEYFYQLIFKSFIKLEVNEPPYHIQEYVFALTVDADI